MEPTLEDKAEDKLKVVVSGVSMGIALGANDVMTTSELQTLAPT